MAQTFAAQIQAAKSVGTIPANQRRTCVWVKVLKPRTGVRAGALTKNHDETRLKIKTGGIDRNNHNQTRLG